MLIEPNFYKQMQFIAWARILLSIAHLATWISNEKYVSVNKELITFQNWFGILYWPFQVKG